MDTSRDISEAAVRNLRRSARAGFCCCCDGVRRDVSPDGWDEVVAAPLPPPARIALIAPVAGMDRAKAKNSSLRSAMVNNRQSGLP